MADLDKAREKPEEQLWDELDRVRAGMLGVDQSGEHMQPMAPNLDRDGKALWFFANIDSDIVRDVGTGAHAHFTMIGKDHDYHACMCGPIKVNKDPARIEEYWSSIVEAWFEDGKDDPKLTMLQLSLKDAAIWASTGNPLAFGWEIAKANLTDGTPDIGVRTSVTFR